MKGFKSAQEAILTVSVVLIVATSVVMTYVYLQTIRIPEKFENTINGDSNEASSRIAEFISGCYRSHRSLGETREDCYVLHISTTNALMKKNVLDKIPDNSVPLEDVIFTENDLYIAKKNTNTTIKITYDGFKKKLIVTKLDDAL